MLDAYGVKVRSLRFLRGPNLHAYKPVMLVTLDIGPYEERPSSCFDGFIERLLTWLPSLAEHQCGLERPGGFVERLRAGTYLGHICEHVTIELQRLVGFHVAFGRARGTGERGVYDVVIAYEEEEPARVAFELALRLVLAAMNDEAFDVALELEQLRDVAELYRLGPSTAAIVAAAHARGIPTRRLGPTESIVQLGWGVHQRRIRAAETPQTSVVATEICQDKLLTNQLLRAVRIPVPVGQVVASADEALVVAGEIGLPVVVKPADGNQGKGVSVELRLEAAVRRAYAIAKKFSDRVLVEQYIVGADFRLLVVGGKMVAAARRDPPVVVGDGQRTVADLVAELNRDSNRCVGHACRLSKIVLDGPAKLMLRQQKLTLSAVPERGRVVSLRQNANLSTGGTAIDVTDNVHPANARVAVLAARTLGLDVAGVDIVCRDISRPLAEQGGAVIEVNASPGLRMHLYPSEGQARDVGGAIVNMLFSANAPARIPVIAVTGTNGKTTVTFLLEHMFRGAGKVVGAATTEGLYVGGERILEGDCSGPESARDILMHPEVEVAVLETARGGILREGLAFDNCAVGIVTNVTGDHLGIGGIATVEAMARVKQVVVESVARDGAAVLNADDPLVAQMAAACPGRVIYFSARADNPTIVEHLATGGQGVFVADDALVLGSGDLRSELIKLAKLRFAGGGKIGFHVQNALAAVAAAWAAGLAPQAIAEGLAELAGDATSLPGRFNVVDLDGAHIILDYGHNQVALKMLGEAIRALYPARDQGLGRPKTTMLIGLPGDRRDDDLRATIDATREYVDAYLVMDQVERRGRAEGEIFRLVRKHLPADVPCAYVRSEEEGIVRALQQVAPGELLIVIVDNADTALEQVNRLAAERADRRRAA